VRSAVGAENPCQVGVAGAGRSLAGGRPWGGCRTRGATFAGTASRGMNGPGAAWLRGDGCLARL
jgi:hypothetical protein